MHQRSAIEWITTSLPFVGRAYITLHFHEYISKDITRYRPGALANTLAFSPAPSTLKIRAWTDMRHSGAKSIFLGSFQAATRSGR